MSAGGSVLKIRCGFSSCCFIKNIHCIWEEGHIAIHFTPVSEVRGRDSPFLNHLSLGCVPQWKDCNLHSLGKRETPGTASINHTPVRTSEPSKITTEVRQV